MHKSDQKGFSLIELLIVVIIIGIIALIYVGSSLRGDEAGGAEALLNVVHSRITERRSDAARLSVSKPIRFPDNYLQKQVITPPLSINFAEPATTAPLQTNSGNDADEDAIDDTTGQPYTAWFMSMTTVIGSNGQPEQKIVADWYYGYSGEPVTLPSGWRLAQTAGELPVPLISNAQHGKGELITKIGFDGSGRAYAFYTDKWLNVSPLADSAQMTDAPFWAIYFYLPNATAAVAVAVHPSGLIENFRWDGAAWRGFENRTIN